MEHQNLFHGAGDRESVYAALQRDYARDVGLCRSWLYMALAILLIAALVGPASHLGWAMMILGLVLALYYQNVFIDNSNRNWAMHVIDWIEASRPPETVTPDPDDDLPTHLPLVPHEIADKW